jgi:hypothetical protein
MRPVAQQQNQIFLSYARDDQEQIGALVAGLRALGMSVWIDDALIAGQAWWNEILEHIRECDVFVQAISRATRQSEACDRERAYARALGKPVLPVIVSEVPPSLIPAELAEVQFVDYTMSTSEAAFRLAGALSRCDPAPALPDPVPPPPAVPVSYLVELSDKVRARALTLDEQAALVARLRPALEGRDAPVAQELFVSLQQRNDLFASTARDIDAALSTFARKQDPLGTSRFPARPAPPQQPPRIVSHSPDAERAPDAGRSDQSGRHSEYAQPRQESVRPHWAIAITGVIFFFPIGVFALVNASRVGPAVKRGDITAAQSSAKLAQILGWSSVAVLIVLAAATA